MTLIVRDAVRTDARTIARIRVDTWRAAYAGLIAAEALDALDAEREGARREERWDEFHADTGAVELIAERDGEAVGWAAIGPSEDSDLPRDGQLFAIYALAGHWSSGVGHALLATAEDRLRSAGFRRAHLWVLDGNTRAADFYERHGWREDGTVVTDERTLAGRVPVALLERRRVRDLTETVPPTAPPTVPGAVTSPPPRP